MQKLSLRQCAELARQYDFTRLVSQPGYNSKFLKAIGFHNAGISLAPARTSGHQVCAASGKCRAPCVAHTGRAEYDPGRIKRSRIGRTKLFFEDRELFWRILQAECWMTQRAADRLGIPVAFRPNTFSDLDWPGLMPALFTEFPAWHFYGYSKVRRTFLDYAAGKLPGNYHITASWSERMTVSEAKALVRDGVNVAVPFFDRETMRGTIPEEWNNLKVIDGDHDDLRFRDPVGCIVGLRTKLPKTRVKAIARIRQSDGFFVGV